MEELALEAGHVEAALRRLAVAARGQLDALRHARRVSGYATRPAGGRAALDRSG